MHRFYKGHPLGRRLQTMIHEEASTQDMAKKENWDVIHQLYVSPAE